MGNSLSMEDFDFVCCVAPRQSDVKEPTKPAFLIVEGQNPQQAQEIPEAPQLFTQEELDEAFAKGLISVDFYVRETEKLHHHEPLNLTVESDVS